MDLSPHLGLAEYLASSHRPLVDDQQRAWIADPGLWLHARYLALDVFEPARDVVGVPLHVTSGFRCAELNRAVGGRPNSRHALALAVDVVPIGRDLASAWEALVAAVRAGRLPHVDQAILEMGWLHLQAAAKGEPRQQLLVTHDGVHFEALDVAAAGSITGGRTMTAIATSKNLTILGILTIAGALIAAGVALLDGDPGTAVNVEATLIAISAGVGMVLGKGAASTGGTVPETPEAVKRVAPAVTAAGSLDLGQPKGFASHGALRLLSVLGVLALPGCAALSKTTIDTGDVDLGKGVSCRTTTAPTDVANCTKLVTQSCSFPLPKNADGICPLDAIAIDIPFQPGKGAQCQVSAGVGSIPCTKLVATSCTLAIPRDAAGACP